MQLAIILCLVLCAVAANASAALRVTLSDLPPVELSFETDQGELTWTESSKSANQARYVSGDLQLTIKAEKCGRARLLRFAVTRADGKPVSLISYSAKIVEPLDGLHAVTVPATRPIAHQLVYYHEHRTWRENVPVYRCRMPEGFEENTRVNNEAPLIILTDAAGANRLCAGWTAANIATRLLGTAEGGSYELTLHRKEDVPIAGAKVEDALFISRAAEPWMEVERAYAMQYDKANGRKHDPIPEWATEPVWCTWYCYSENIDQNMMLEVGRKCKELGLTTVLIDAGWDKKPGEWWGDLDKSAIGDYAASPELFPDLPGLVKQLHGMGLKVQLWASPFWQAKGSKSYQQKTKDWMVQTEEGESTFICPKHPGTRKVLREAFAKIARDYNIDGMWLDVCDGVPGKCIAKHEHLDQTMGGAFVDCMMAMREGLRSVNPEAIIEARVLHANLNVKPALDVVACSDTPRSFEIIRLASIQLRPWAYDVLVKNDPMIWPEGSDKATVGKYLATMCCNGVPGLSVDVLKLPDWEAGMIKAWLKFYHEHKQTILKGRFSLFGADAGTPDMLLARGGEAIVYIRNPKTESVELPKQVKRILLLNCTDSDNIRLRIEGAEGKWELRTYAPDWREEGVPASIAAKGALELSRYVPQGGAAELSVER